MERPIFEKKENLAEELDIEKNHRLFTELPSDKIELLANHLSRPDSFAKILITGEIVTSEELEEKIGYEFVKTHRGYYMSYPPNALSGKNPDISFNIGLPQRDYGEVRPGTLNDWKKGLGFVLPAEKLMARDSVTPSWGAFHLRDAAEKLKSGEGLEPEFEKYVDLDPEASLELDYQPPKKDFLTLVNFARKGGQLYGGDQAEVNMREENGVLPRLPLEEVIILIPQKSEEAIERYLNKKIKELAPYAEKLRETFGIELEGLTSERVLARYKNIYWYPQHNIGEAAEYLTTHPEWIKEFLTK